MYIEPKIGDSVRHTQFNLGRHQGATIVSQDITSPERWCIRYDSGMNGAWLKQYTVLAEDNAQMSEANAIMPPNSSSQYAEYLEDMKIRAFDNLVNHPVTREYFPPVSNKISGRRADLIIFDDINPPENTMKAELQVTKVNDVITSTSINGVEVKSLDTDQLISHIQKSEQKVGELQAIKVESKAIKAEIKRLNKFIKDVVVILDKK